MSDKPDKKLQWPPEPETPSEDISADDVKELLNEKKSNDAFFEGVQRGQDIILSEEELENLDEKIDEVDDIDEERKTTPVEDYFDTKINPTTREILDWESQDSELGNITVSDNEKDAYWNSMLFDEPLVLNWNMEIAGRSLNVEVTSLSGNDRDILVRALEIDENENLTLNLGMYNSRVQHYCIAFQFRKLDGKSLNYFEARPVDGIKSYREYLCDEAERLRKHIEKDLIYTQITRWQIFSKAIRIFENKLKICNDALLNKNFWKPANTETN